MAKLLCPIYAPASQLRTDGCGGLAAKAELLTGIEGVSSRLVRKILLLG
jgi:hypothetical protein